MGEADRYGEYKKERRKFTLGDDNNAVVALFAINVIFFLLLTTIKVIYLFVQSDVQSFANNSLQLFQLPASLSTLVTRPWTIVTCMFSEINVMAFLGNMLWLWAFGSIFQQLAGNKKVIPVYIYGGLAGALIFIIAANAIPVFRADKANFWLLGANASNMALAMAATLLAPNFRFFENLGGGIPIWVLMLVYVLIDFAGVASLAAPYSLSHLAGAVAGFAFVAFARKGYDGSIWMHKLYNWFMNLFSPNKQIIKPNVKEKVFYTAGDRKPYKKYVNVTQQRIDEILDKINQKGYHFLTEEEKNILKRASEDDNS